MISRRRRRFALRFARGKHPAASVESDEQRDERARLGLPEDESQQKSSGSWQRWRDDRSRSPVPKSKPDGRGQAIGVYKWIHPVR